MRISQGTFLMVQQVTLAEDRGSTPSTHTGEHNYLSLILECFHIKKEEEEEEEKKKKKKKKKKDDDDDFWAGEITQQLRAFALVKPPGLIPSTYTEFTIIFNYSSRGSDAPF
ncbi:hypothetical protein STEG23_004688 [Scotinomys teguina]